MGIINFFQKLILLLIISSYPINLFADLNNGLVAHYNFDDGVNNQIVSEIVDTGPNALHGRVIKELYYSKFVYNSSSNGTLSLNAKNDYAFGLIEDNVLFHLQGNLTVATFVYPINGDNKGGVNPHSIVHKLNYGGSGVFLSAFCLFYNQDKGHFGALISFGVNNGIKIITENKFVDSKWYHVAMTYSTEGDNGNLNLFVNGNIEVSKTFKAQPLYYGKEPLYIGAGNYATSSGTGTYRRNFIGYIDDIRIYDRVLNKEEIIEITFTENDCNCADNDNDGVPNQWDKCPNTQINSYVNRNGCPLYDNSAVSGRVLLKGRPLNKGSATLIQSGELFQKSPLDNNGGFKFDRVTEQESINIMIRKPVE